MKRLKLLISCGEVSGDQRAAEVVESLKEMCPSVHIRGMGGSQLVDSGIDLVVDARKGAGVMGFVEVASKMTTLYRSYTAMVNEIKSWRPDALLLVDFPDFNLRLARIARNYNIPVYYYIPPKVWAWRAGRVAAIRRTVSWVGCVFPFEPEYYLNDHYMNAEYVGHPFVQSFSGPTCSKREICDALGLNDKNPIALVMAGSRSAEVSRHIPPLVEALVEVRRSIATLQIVWVAPSLERKESLERTVCHQFDKLGMPTDYHFFTHGDAKNLMYYSDFGLLKSGTCNLEAAFAGLPFISFYKASPISVLIARYVVKIQEFSLVNICKPHSVTELIQESCTGKAMAKAIQALLPRSDLIKQDLADVRALFGKSSSALDSAPAKVARKVLSLMEQAS